MAEKLVNNTGLSEFATKIKESVPLVGTTTYTSGNISLDSMGSYSLNEIETPFTWIDGKTIYKKTVDCGNLPNATTKRIPSGISGLDLIIKFDAIQMSSDQTGFYMQPFASATRTNDCIEIQYLKTDNTIFIYTLHDWSSYKMYVTLYYTKS